MKKLDTRRAMLLGAIALAICCAAPLILGLLLATGLGAALFAR